MALLTTKQLNFAYPDGGVCLRDISLTVEPGQFAVLCGPSGCGKTTLLRQFKQALVPRGQVSGAVEFDGRPLDQVDPREQAARIGFVQQRPGNQIVTDKVWHELAFGLESLGYSNRDIRLKVAETASYFGIQTWFHRSVSELSGGQQQLLSLASALTLGPDLLILDEPTAQLDPIAARSFLDTLVQINRELGTAILLSEHRLEEALPPADTLTVMDRGRVIASGAPKAVCAELAELGHPMFAAMPTPVQVAASTGARDALPLTVREGRAWLDNRLENRTPAPIPVPPEPDYGGLEKAVETREVYFAYGPQEPDVVRGLDLTVYTGELFALVGGNGAGKTTALNLLSGLNRPQRGKVRILGEDGSKIRPELVGVLPQDPQLLFLRNTVSAELEEALDGAGLSREARRDRIAQVVGVCELEGLLDRHPYDLSGGEQQRAALAKVLLTGPRLLLLDEPTKGLEQAFKDRLAEVLGRLRQSGMTIILVSHDIEFCARHATRCGLFFDGAIAALGTPRQVLAENTYYTTAARRMAGHRLPDVLTAADVIKACGGVPVTLQDREAAQPPSPLSAAGVDSSGNSGNSGSSGRGSKVKGKTRLTRPVVASIVMLLLAIPATIWWGITFLENRRYLIISMLVLVEALLPFFIAFEGKRPRARELVVLAVLCSIAVLGRVIFFMVPQFKPVAALVIISGVALGGHMGFLVGAISAIASNLFYGQGPWTPWQMLAFGLIGFLAGLLFYRRDYGHATPKMLPLCLYGFFSVLILYGGILNPASVLMFQGEPTWSMIAAYYLSGLPMDLVHAGSTVVFLIALARPMLEKLDRVKVKYGLV